MKKENKMSKLSITQRTILQYIKYRCNNNHLFFEGNETIAEHIGTTIGSTKEIINKLIRNEYLEKKDDGIHKRVLSLSGKAYQEINWVNFNDVDKRILKKKLDETTKEYNRYSDWIIELQVENRKLQNEIERLEQENAELRHQSAVRGQQSPIDIQIINPPIKLHSPVDYERNKSMCETTEDTEKDPNVAIQEIMAQLGVKN